VVPLGVLVRIQSWALKKKVIALKHWLFFVGSTDFFVGSLYMLMIKVFYNKLNSGEL
jgi:uncharacterized membrane protein YgdD (TMEM256/DUF423 family)